MTRGATFTKRWAPGYSRVGATAGRCAQECGETATTDTDGEKQTEAEKNAIGRGWWGRGHGQRAYSAGKRHAVLYTPSRRKKKQNSGAEKKIGPTYGRPGQSKKEVARTWGFRGREAGERTTHALRCEKEERSGGRWHGQARVETAWAATDERKRGNVMRDNTTMGCAASEKKSRTHSPNRPPVPRPSGGTRATRRAPAAPCRSCNGTSAASGHSRQTA